MKSAQLSIERLTKKFGDVTVLDGIDLEVEPGQFVCVIGPSGSGKTTLLRVIAGHEEAHGGTMRLGEQMLAGPAGQRNTAMVFQTGTLFPDLTVAENVAFGLKARGETGPAAQEKVAVALLRLGMSGVASRYPDEISGGQQRRVALARALVLSPSLLLLDEPLDGLDRHLRWNTLALLRSTQRRLGITTVLVTHDQQEALSAADVLVVMLAGRVEQAGPPQQVYQRPHSLFVAEFLGRSSFLPVTAASVRDGRARIHVFGTDVDVPCHPEVRAGHEAVLVMRPHALSVRACEPCWGDLRGDYGVVTVVNYLGDRVDYDVEVDGGALVVRGHADAVLLEENQPVRVSLEPSQAWLLPRES